MSATSSRQSRSSTGRHRQAAKAHGSLALVPVQDMGPGIQGTPKASSADRHATLAVFGAQGELISLSNERRELLCSIIGLSVKFGLVAVAAVSLFRLSSAYQQRMDRQGEIAAVLELETAKLAKSRERFDKLFTVSGEQQLIREQSQWIAPNRLRVVWQPGRAFSTVETASAPTVKVQVRP